jgi:RNA-directed DNA polymerase
VPTDESLKHVHRRIVALLTSVATDFPPHVTGYVRDRSTFANALPHVGNPFMQRFDLADFFGHVSRSSISRGLADYGFSQPVAEMLARLVTVSGKLPTGFATSPAMANVSMSRFDAELAELADLEGVAVTRYADDVAFSGHKHFDMRDQMADLASRHGHELNDAKTRQLKHGQPLYVTGLSVADRDGPRLPKPFKRRIRQELHYIARYGLAEHAARTREETDRVVLRLGGQLAYARAIEPAWVDVVAKTFAHSFALVYPAPSALNDALRAQSLERLAERIRANPADRAPAYTPTTTYSA